MSCESRDFVYVWKHLLTHLPLICRRPRAYCTSITCCLAQLWPLCTQDQRQVRQQVFFPRPVNQSDTKVSAAAFYRRFLGWVIKKIKRNKIYKWACPWPCVLSLPRAQGGFVGDPTSLERDNIMLFLNIKYNLAILQIIMLQYDQNTGSPLINCTVSFQTSPSRHHFSCVFQGTVSWRSFQWMRPPCYWSDSTISCICEARRLAL